MTETTDLVEEQESKKFDLQSYLNLVRRRHLHFLIPLFIGWALVWGASWILSARYKSGTLILVQQSTMPKNYVEPNVSEDIQDRLQSITQQILSRTRLLMVIDNLHLYANAKGSLTPDAKVEMMQKDITIELVRGTNNGDISAFRIYYTAHSPRIAQQVTAELTNLFINENLKVRQQESEGTTQFMQTELENARAALAEQEAKVKDFEGKHEGELPTQQASNLQILAGLQTQLQAEQDSLNNANQQKVYFQSLIEQYKTIQETTRTANGTQMSVPAIDAELEQLRSERASLAARYTEKHPDILRLNHEIAKAEKLRSELMASAKDSAKDKASQDAESATSKNGGATQNTALLQLQSQLRATEAEIGNRTETINRLKARIGQYQSRLDGEPMLEQELADLTRGYDQSKADYDALLKKKNDSEMATSMEEMQQGQRFRILDPPSLPTSPEFPNRLKFCGIGVIVGIALGLIVVGCFEFLDDRMQSEDAIKALLPVAIISEIPEIMSPDKESKNKRQLMVGWATTGVIFVALMVGSMYSYLHQ
jgi:polysaccharide chain length determinant protein (PEP-CTERM system associated)